MNRVGIISYSGANLESVAPLEPVLGIFEGDRKRLLWLPSLTLGYLYTLSGATWDFVLAIVAVGGGKLLIGMLKSGLVPHEGGKSAGEIRDYLQVELSVFQQFKYALVLVIYVFALICAPWRLYLYFTHTDPVLVGFAGVYFGILVAIVSS